MFNELLRRGYDVRTLQHARTILETEFAEAITELQSVLLPISVPIEELVFGGGGKTKVVQRLEARFNELAWTKHNFQLTKLVDGIATQAISHEIDHVKRYGNGVLALEIEWNNKDPFFDRDLQSFRQLHADGAISMGLVITRGASLQDGIREKIVEFALANGITSVEHLAQYYSPTRPQQRAILKSQRGGQSFAEAWAGTFVASKFGQSTTHWGKLIDRVERGVGNPCPLVLIGIPIDVITF